MKRLISTLLLAALLCGCLVSGALAGSDDALEQFGSIADTICGLDGPPSDEQLSALLSDLEALDFDAAEEDNGLTGSMVGDSTNVQMLFYKLQLELAQQAKESAQETIEQIQQQNEKQRLCSQFINEARTTVSNLSGDKTVAVPEDMLDFLQENSLYVPADPSAANIESWRAIVSALEYHQESIGASVQQNMVYIQDFIGQYNSYSQASQSVLAGAGSLSGSATMLGSGGAGLAVTALIAGLVLGALVTALVLKKKKPQA